MFDRVKRVFEGSRSPTVVFECRSCGTSVDRDTDTCPECGSDEIAHYEIP